jgi:carbon storage regulator
MLKLGRKSGQSVLIGDDIRVMVLGISGDNVSLGFDAPQEVPILRAEKYEGGKLERKHDFGPVSYLAHQIYCDENPYISWEQIPTEIRYLYKSKAEGLIYNWRKEEQ